MSNLLVEPRPKCWADGSEKASEILEAEAKLDLYREAEILWGIEENREGSRGAFLERVLADPEIKHLEMMVLEASEDQRLLEAEADAAANPGQESDLRLRYVRYWREDRRHRRGQQHNDVAPLTRATQTTGTSREARASAGRSRGSHRRTKQSSDSDGDGSGGGSDEPPGLRCKAGCGYAKKSSAGQAKYCDRPACEKARNARRQRECRAKAPIPTRHTDLYDEVADRWIAVHPLSDVLHLEGVHIGEREGRLNLRREHRGREADGIELLDLAATAWLEGRRDIAVALVEPYPHERVGA